MQEERIYSVYILSNYTNTVVYVGVSSQLEVRISQHKQKLVKGFTQKYNVDKLVYCEHFSDMLLAVERERQIQGWKREKKNQLIEKENPTWKDLANTLFE